MQIFLGLVGIVVGVLYTIYSDKIADQFGPISWFEEKLGSGSSYTVHKFIGILIIIISLLWTTGTFQYLLRSSLGRLFGMGA